MSAVPTAEAAPVRPPLKWAGGKRWLVPRDNRSGFTVIEVIGVLAVLVIVLCLVLPGTLRRANQVPQLNSTVDEARIEQTVIALQSLKTAAQERLAQFGSLAAKDGVTPGNGDDYDKQLVREGFLEKPFAAGVGTRCVVRLLNASTLTAASPVNGVPGAYDLDGDGGNDVIHARWVLEAVIFGVTDVEAKALNDRLDGPSLGPVAGNDSKGRVIWTGQSKEVRIYIAQGN